MSEITFHKIEIFMAKITFMTFQMKKKILLCGKEKCFLGLKKSIRPHYFEC